MANACGDQKVKNFVYLVITENKSNYSDLCFHNVLFPCKKLVCVVLSYCDKQQTICCEVSAGLKLNLNSSAWGDPQPELCQDVNLFFKAVKVKVYVYQNLLNCLQASHLLFTPLKFFDSSSVYAHDPYASLFSLLQHEIFC